MRVTRRIAVCLPIAAAGLGMIGLSLAGLNASAQTAETIKIGIVIPMTGACRRRPRGRGGAKLYMAQHGDTVAGKKIELIIRDDGTIPDNAKRLAQELVVNDKVNFLGAGLRRAPWRWRRSRPKPRCRPL